MKPNKQSTKKMNLKQVFAFLVEGAKGMQVVGGLGDTAQYSVGEYAKITYKDFPDWEIIIQKK